MSFKSLKDDEKNFHLDENRKFLLVVQIFSRNIVCKKIEFISVTGRKKEKRLCFAEQHNICFWHRIRHASRGITNVPITNVLIFVDYTLVSRRWRSLVFLSSFFLFFFLFFQIFLIRAGDPHGSDHLMVRPKIRKLTTRKIQRILRSISN